MAVETSRRELEQKKSQLEVIIISPVLRELKEEEVKTTEKILKATETRYQEKKAEKETMESKYQEADGGWFHKFDKLLQEKLTVYVGNIVYEPTASAFVTAREWMIRPWVYKLLQEKKSTYNTTADVAVERNHTSTIYTFIVNVRFH